MYGMTGKIGDGCATRVTIIKEGKELELKLAVIERKGIFGGCGKMLGYANKEQNIFTDGSFYSGGRTGCGKSIHELETFPGRNEAVLITDDLGEIFKLVEQATAEAEAEEAQEQKEKYAKVDRINALPEIIELPDFPELYIYRGKAEYNPKWRNQITGNYVDLNIKPENFGKEGFDPSCRQKTIVLSSYYNKKYDHEIKEYKTTYQGKKFQKDFTTVVKDKNPVEVLKSLITHFEVIEQMVKNA